MDRCIRDVQYVHRTHRTVYSTSCRGEAEAAEIGTVIARPLRESARWVCSSLG